MSADRCNRIRRVWAAGLAAAAMLTAGCSPGAGSGSAPLHPGDLLTSQVLSSAAALPSASSNRLITYASEDSYGQRVVVSGTVAIPKSQPPKGGWPVISWAHGTTGYADTCAPSADFDGGPAHDYLGLIDATLDQWVARGFAVVQTDYQGLGTPGGAPYSNGASEANTVIDIIRAARDLDPSIGTDWVAMGHSQGGQAALFTAADATKRAPELTLKGAVAIAPGSGFGPTVQFVASAQPGAEAAEPFLPLLALGAAVADPAIDPDKVFMPQFSSFVSTARAQCLGQIRALTPIPAGKVFVSGPDLDKFTNYLAQQEPANLTPQVPVMIAQGLADTTVLPARTDALVKTYCDKRFDVTYRTYPAADHRAAVAGSLTDTEHFIDNVLRGQSTPDTCRA